LVLNGYSDWYLPSLGELQMMHGRLHLQGLGGFGGNWLWSSSQSYPDQVWTMIFDTGNGSNYYKGNYLQVRAVRAF
ncbi:MAG: hypothetical protein ACKOFE_00940, partial [Bacteroidota bacterium]